MRTGAEKMAWCEQVREKRSERRCKGVWTAVLCVEKLVSFGWHVTADCVDIYSELQT